MSGWTAVTFSEEQQTRFAVNEYGDILDEDKHAAALQALVAIRPPWWVLYHVKPEGQSKDMGGWAAATFSEEQQKRFAVDEDGDILDEDKHAAALRALADEEEEDVAVRPRDVERPWWVLHHVKPEGKPRDMGGWTAVTFSEEQQRRFAVNEDGDILDEDE